MFEFIFINKIYGNAMDSNLIVMSQLRFQSTEHIPMQQFYSSSSNYYDIVQLMLA